MPTGWDWDAAARDRLGAFLSKRGLTTGPVVTSRIGDGLSNLTFLVRDDAGHELVVRRPPPPPLPPGANDVLREARFVGALDASAVPVARVLATAPAGTVLDVPMYAMTFVAGEVITTTTPPPMDDPRTRARLGRDLIDVLADLHTVDWRAAGLGDLGHPEGFNTRHIERLARLVADPDGRPPDDFEAIETWLRQHAPTESGAAIVHNDYRLGNVVTSAAGAVAAVLDWELATIGDPLFDLGYFLSSIPAPDELGTPTQELGAAMLEDGWPSRSEFAQRYTERTGADLTPLPWYSALAQWKLAVLYEYQRRRADRGVGDAYYADPDHVRRFLAAAHRAAGIGTA